MPRYLISFDDGWMTFPDEDLPEVARAAAEVVREAQEAGVWVYGAGLESQRASIVATDGVVTDGPYPETKEIIGGFAIVDVPSRAGSPRQAMASLPSSDSISRTMRSESSECWTMASRSAEIACGSRSEIEL